MPEIMVRFDDLRRYCEDRHCGSVPLEYINQMRTVEAEPVKHAEWISDLIERDALLKDLKSDCPDSDVCIAETSCIECIIGRQPAVNRWIPCSERLPENFNYVIAAGSDGIGIVRYNGTLFVDDSGAIYPMYALTHWMPLPDPPAAELRL